MSRKPKIVNLPPIVPLWRKTFADGVVTVWRENGKPLTLERVNFLLDNAKQSIWKD